MNFFKVLFSKQEGSKIGRKKKAIAFVDYEHWYISLDKMYHIRPDVKAFRDELSDRYDIVDIAFFGDFSNPSLRSEIFNIRQVSNTIIETQNASANFEKDFTDFIMLDHIYQSAIKADSKSIDAYIIFTGDGHFSSAVSFLATKCRKEVGVYAVKDACSAQLVGCATYARLLPEDEQSGEQYKRMILKSLKVLFDKNKKKKVRATFWQTVEAVSKANHVNKEDVSKALRELISKGYIYQVRENDKSDSIKILRVNWQSVYRDRLL